MRGRERERELSSTLVQAVYPPRLLNLPRSIAPPSLPPFFLVGELHESAIFVIVIYFSRRTFLFRRRVWKGFHTIEPDKVLTTSFFFSQSGSIKEQEDCVFEFIDFGFFFFFFLIFEERCSTDNEGDVPSIDR